MWSFEGDFCSKPKQSLGGASGQGQQRDALVKRAKEEREKRAHQRKREASAQKIQCFYRGFQDRKKQTQKVRGEFDTELHEASKGSGCVNPALLQKLIHKLSFFFSPQTDGQRLVSICQFSLKKKEDYLAFIFQNPTQAVLQLKRLLEMNLRYLESIVGGPSPFAVPMRMVEVFTAPSVYSQAAALCGTSTDVIVAQIFRHLIRNGYFQCMKEILQHKVPSSLERSPTPPTPVAASVLSLIMSPISFATHTSDRAFSREVLLAVCRTLLCPVFTEQVAQFLIPAMAYGKFPFPFVDLIQALIASTSTSPPHSSTSPSSPKLSPSASLTSTSSKLASASSENLLGSPWLLYSVLVLGEPHIGQLDGVNCVAYLELLRRLIPSLPPDDRAQRDDDDDEDMEEEQQASAEQSGSLLRLREVREECVRLLDCEGHLSCLLACLRQSLDEESVERVAALCHLLLFQLRTPMHKMRLLYSLAFNTGFVRSLWTACTSVSMKTVTGSSNSLLMMLSSGLPMQERDVQRIVPLLSTFCAMFSYSLLTLHDADFHGDTWVDSTDQCSSMPFVLREVVPMSLKLRNACLGIIELAHPDAKFSINDDYSHALHKSGIKRKNSSQQDDRYKQSMWEYLFKVISTLVRQIYVRDSRRPFCVPDHWLSSQVSIYKQSAPSRGVFFRRPFICNRIQLRGNMDDDMPPLSNRELRNLIILTELPFVVSFEERVKILQGLIMADKQENQGDIVNFAMGPTISVMIRRPYIYEDAFDKLSVENEPNLKLKMRVQLVNAAGLDEAGIDGGGIFREFLSELLKAGFDPNRGYFQHTTDQLLYPNPQASLLEPQFRKHFFFLGRMLGKALMENMLVELPFASFFLSKILSQHSANLDIHHLQSMDPIMYKNLLFLKTYDGDVSDLGLDFTVVTDHFGETKMQELKPGGCHISVTKDNRIEYIHLMADYFLNKQMRAHCMSFREGLADVIKLDWLQMFSSQELQVLISGASIPVDIADLRRHTHYNGSYSDNHPTIVMFWDVVTQFTDKQKRQLLKFVTSCSRPPLLGFRDLYPQFCVNNAGQEPDRLPTASTCMNLLKLPEFTDENTLRTKLLYAIESGAGFELS